jgi:hypothetical protein
MPRHLIIALIIVAIVSGTVATFSGQKPDPVFPAKTTNR